MNYLELMKQRHAVRKYTNQSIPRNTKETIQHEIALCNKESGLNIQLITEEPKAFGSWFTHFGRFSGVQNYIALVGTETATAYENCGHYGERLVLLAQSLGLNTCWVSNSYKSSNAIVKLNPKEKLLLVISIGYGRDNGKPSKSKSITDVADIHADQPAWFKQGIAAALLAPTAMNKQNFHFTLQGNQVSCKCDNKLLSKVDLGIIKYHFEAIVGKDNFNWV